MYYEKIETFDLQRKSVRRLWLWVHFAWSVEYVYGRWHLAIHSKLPLNSESVEKNPITNNSITNYYRHDFQRCLLYSGPVGMCK